MTSLNCYSLCAAQTAFLQNGCCVLKTLLVRLSAVHSYLRPRAVTTWHAEAGTIPFSFGMLLST